MLNSGKLFQRLVFLFLVLCLLNVPINGGASLIRRIQLMDMFSNLISYDNPLPVNSKRVFQNHIDYGSCTVNTFVSTEGGESALDGVRNLFINGATGITDPTSNNPKVLEIAVGFDNVTAVMTMQTKTGDFSNLKIEYINHDGTINKTDDRFFADATDRTKILFDHNVSGWEILRLTFATADPVTITRINSIRSQDVIAKTLFVDPEGNIQNQGGTREGRTSVSSLTEGIEIAKGVIPGTGYINKFGTQLDIDTADAFVYISAQKDVADTFAYPTTNDISEMSSNDNGDTQDIEIIGLYDDGSGGGAPDGLWILHTQTITLTGQTPVALDQNLIRVFRAENVNGTVFAGLIYITSTGSHTAGVPDDPDDIMLLLDPVLGQKSETTRYCIPSRLTVTSTNPVAGYLRYWWAGLANKKVATSLIAIEKRNFGSVFTTIEPGSVSNGSNIGRSFQTPERFEAKTDFRIVGDTSTNDTAIAAGFDIQLFEDI